MKFTKVGLAVGIALGIFGTSVMASTCEINFTRTACPGKEEISFSKCNGKASCTESKDTASAEQCKKLATDACENKRVDITKSKVITAKFNGKDVKSDGGDTDFCKAYSRRANEFDKC